MPHAMMGEFTRSKNAMDQAKKVLDALILSTSVDSTVREFFEDSVFNLSAHDDQWTMEFDFSPGVEIPELEKEFIKMVQEVSKVFGFPPEREDAGILKYLKWDNRPLKLVFIFHHSPQIADNKKPQDIPAETIEDGADGTTPKKEDKKCDPPTTAPTAATPPSRASASRTATARGKGAK